MTDTGFDGSRLRVARDLRGVSIAELAAQISLSAGYVSHVERGTREPTALVQESIAEALRFRVHFFQTPVRAIGEDECNFRSRRTTAAGLRNRARARGTLLMDLVHAVEKRVDGIPEYSVPFVSGVGSPEEAARAAEQVRLQLGLGVAGPIVDVVGVLEHCGVIVTRLEGTNTKIDAFSWRRDRGIVVLSADKQSASRARFDAAHELGHLAMHHDHALEPGLDAAREEQANSFARAFLMPPAAFARDFPRSLDWPRLFEMKAYWGASVGAIVYHARKLGLLGAIDYQRAQKTMSARGWRSGSEPAEPEVEEPGALRDALEAVDLEEVILELGWHDDVFELVSGHPAPPPPPVAGVVDLAAVRRARS